MPSAPNNIFIIDDDSDSAYARVVEPIFPNSNIANFSDFESALEKMEQGARPDLLLLDATEHGWHPEWGAGNALNVLIWLRENAPEHPLPYIVFHSNDEDLALKAKQVLKKDLISEGFKTHPDIVATDKSEVGLVRDIVSVRNGERSGLRTHQSGKRYTELRKLLNRRYDLDLPVTQESLDEFVLLHGKGDPESVMRMVDSGKLSREEGLKKIAGDIPFRVGYDIKPSLDIYGKEHDTTEAMAVQFQRGTGEPVSGPVVFRAEDAIKVAQKGEKPILVTQDVTPEIVQLFKYVAGIVVLSKKASGHVEMLAQAHRIPALLAKRNDRFREKANRYVRINKPANEGGEPPHLSITTQVNLWGSDIDPKTLINRGVEEIKRLPPKPATQPEAREEAEEFGDPDYEDRSSKYSHKIKIVVRTGRDITIDPENTRLYPLFIPVNERSYDSHSWLPDAKEMLRDWHEDNGIPRLRFKHNVDFAYQTSAESSSGVGLVRTEHLVISSSNALQAFREIVLNRNTQALLTFEHLQKEDFYRLLEPLCHSDDFPIRIRLIDAPPSEFFDEQGLNKIATAYDDRKIRGVQLAAKVPEIYEAQIRAVFNAYNELAERAKEDESFYRPPQGPVEIMVPTVKTAAELAFVKQQVDGIADELGVAKTSYRFGSMLETVDACKNIASIAPLCDFISIGSNDLTSEILNCDRDDWTKRRKLTIDSGKSEDPFITIHPNVVKALVPAIEQARAANPSIQVDICGAHAADLPSLNALRPLRLDSVSAPPSPQNQDALAILYMLETFQLHMAEPKVAPRASRRRGKPIAPAGV